METFIFSKHAIEQMELRGISKKVVLDILNNPQKIISEKEQKIYQSIIIFGQKNIL